MKRICIVVTCFIFLLQMLTVSAFAEELPKNSVLTVEYSAEDISFDGLDVKTFRVADIKEDGSYSLCGAFSKYPVSLEVVRTQDEWRTIATTLSSYIVADGIAADSTAVTDSDGKAVFEGLEKGLYLVFGVQDERNGKVYSFEGFFTPLPRPDADGVPQYEVTALPKHTTHVPEPERIEYKVVKQWKDEGHSDRPTSVTVEIYNDDELVTTEKLSSENNWSYTWTAEDDGSKWSVVETDIPEGYTVTVTDSQTTFIVTNSYVTAPPLPPMGDVSVAWPYVLALFSLGAVLLIISAQIKKVNND